jgi:hypothetical protein
MEYPMTHQENAPTSSDNDHAVPPSGAAHLVGTEEDDTTDDEFMQLVAQVNAETDAAGTPKTAPQTEQGEAK